MHIRTGLLALGLGALAGCAGADIGLGGVFGTKNNPGDLAMRWDGQTGAAAWTADTFQALDDHGAALVATMPADIEGWCPGYEHARPAGRKAFWTGLLSTLAKHESSWDPRAVGGGGRWFGLVQISPATARDYGCAAGTGVALKDGAANLSCAVRIMNVTVPRDGVVSDGMRGVAADWGPFHNGAKRDDMMSWMRAQPYCRA